MKPVRHARSNTVYKGPTPDIGDLWCQRVEPGQILVVYELSDWERAQIAEGARVELAMYCEPIPPVAVNVLAPGECEPVGEHPWRGQSVDDIPDSLPPDWAA